MIRPTKYASMGATSGPAQVSWTSVRGYIFGALFAALIVPNSILVMCFGFAGLSGGSVFTGGFLTVITLGIGLLYRRGQWAMMPTDYLFATLVALIAVSFALNVWVNDARELALLVLSLGAYLVCRSISSVEYCPARSSLILTLAVIVVAGTAATCAALIPQWDSDHGKPLVFDFSDAAPTFFLQSLGFLILALATSGKLNLRQTAIATPLIFFSIAVYAASLVRFTFLALVGSLVIAVMFSQPRQRRYVIAMLLVVSMGIGAGLTARFAQVKRMSGHIFEQSQGEPGLDRPPSCYLNVNPSNSISIRKALAQDAMFLIPRSGWFGTGLDSFMTFSCIKRNTVHNSILQTFVEFGWLGGATFVVLLIAAAVPLLPLARREDPARFILCGLAFSVSLSLAHGRISRDIPVFAFLGAAAGLCEAYRSRRHPSPTFSAVL